MHHARDLWKRVTTPYAIDEDEAQQEYMTRVILTMLEAMLLIFTVPVVVGWSSGLFQFKDVLTMLVLDLFIGFGGWQTYRGHWRRAAYIPPIVFLALAVYVTYPNGLITTALLFYVIAILLSAMLISIQAQWVVVALSIVLHLTVGWIHADWNSPGEKSLEMLASTAIVISGAFIGIALIQQLSTRQLKHALLKTRNHATELDEYHHNLQKSIAELENLQKITQALLSLAPLHRVMHTVTEGIVTHLGYDSVLVSRYLEAQPVDNTAGLTQPAMFTGLALHPIPQQFDRLLSLIGRPELRDVPTKFRLPYRRGENPLIDRVLDGETVRSHSLADMFEPWVPRVASDATQKLIGLQTFIDVPMQVKGKTIGTIMAGVRKPSISQSQQQALIRVAGQAAIAIENVRLYEKTAHLKTFNESIVQGVAEAILMVDAQGFLTFANPAAETLLGYTAEELAGQPWTYILPESNVNKVQQIWQQKPCTTSAQHYELNILSKSGHEIPVIASTQPLFERTGADCESEIAGILIACTNITDRKHAEEQIAASLQEKDILLREIHHRVKNNLQIISSLLNLQSSYVHDPRTLEIFRDSQNRIRSMALIHEKLYRSENLARVDFAEYLRSLVTYLFRSYESDAKDIQLTINAEDMVLGLNTAIPCGLLVNELVTNALKHAFGCISAALEQPANGLFQSAPNDRSREIRIEIYEELNQQVSLVVSDNGIGFPHDIDFRNTTTLGLQLVNTLVEQLQGHIELKHAPGTTFTITFSRAR